MISEVKSRKAYSTDVSDSEWVLIEPLVTKEVLPNRAGRRREVSLREVVNPIFMSTAREFNGNCCHMIWLRKARRTITLKNGVTMELWTKL